MKSKKAKSNILAKLKDIGHFDWESNSIPNQSDFLFNNNLLDDFINKLEALKGKTYLIKNRVDLKSTLNSIIQSENVQSLYCQIEEVSSLISEKINITSVPNEDISITGCDFLVSNSGSVVVSSLSGPSRLAYVLPRIQVIIAKKEQLYSGLDEALDRMLQKYKKMPSWYSVITGPSRTADIEKTLVLGAHGPKKLIVIIDVS